MYIKYVQDVHMKWMIAQARRRFSEMLRQSTREPQEIYRRDQLVAVVCSPETVDELATLRRESAKGKSVRAAFDELREISARERYVLSASERRDRGTPWDVGSK